MFVHMTVNTASESPKYIMFLLSILLICNLIILHKLSYAISFEQTVEYISMKGWLEYVCINNGYLDVLLLFSYLLRLRWMVQLASLLNSNHLNDANL